MKIIGCPVAGFLRLIKFETLIFPGRMNEAMLFNTGEYRHLSFNDLDRYGHSLE